MLLHGCRQTPEEIAAGTRITALADERDWLVLLPRQAKDANAWGCWNWFDQRTRPARAKPQSSPRKCGRCAVTTARTRGACSYVGMSSGACLAAVLGLRFARLFAAVGVAFGRRLWRRFNPAAR